MDFDKILHKARQRGVAFSIVGGEWYVRCDGGHEANNAATKIEYWLGGIAEEKYKKFVAYIKSLHIHGLLPRTIGEESDREEIVRLGKLVEEDLTRQEEEAAELKAEQEESRVKTTVLGRGRRGKNTLYPFGYETPEQRAERIYKETGLALQASINRANSQAAEGVEVEWLRDGDGVIIVGKFLYLSNGRKSMHTFAVNGLTGEMSCDCDIKKYNPKVPCKHEVWRENENKRNESA